MSEINTDSLRNERMLFLKELASLPDRDAYELCDTLSIPKVKVMTFLRTYFKAYATFSDRDDRLPKQSYQDLRNEISTGVASEFGELSDKDIDNLCYVYDKYRKIDPQLYIEADQVKAGKLYEPQVAHNSSSIPNQPGIDVPHTPYKPPQAQEEGPKTADYYNRPTGARPSTVNDPNQAEFNVDRLNKGYSYDFLYGLSRIGLLRFVLEGLPYPPSGNKVEGFVQFFELNQDELMASPDAMRDRLQKYFGDKTGEQASVAFNSYIRYLKPGEKFGVSKLRGQLRDGYFLGDDPMYARGPQQQGNSAFGTIPMQYSEGSGMWGPGAEGAAVRNQGAGPRWQDPYNTYYHAELVLPFGMDARSTDAARLIHEWEAKKKRKREDDEANAEILQKINQKMSFSMADVLNQGKMMGNGQRSSMIGPDFIEAMIAMQMIASVNSGKANVMPYTDENGKMQIRMEAVPHTDQQGLPDPNAIGPKDIIQLIQSMYEKIGEKSNEAMQARIDGLKDAMGFNGERKDPIQQVGETVKALRETIPGFDRQFSGGGYGDPAEMARLDLERQKFSYDRERSDKLIDQSYEIKKMEREHEMEAELEANKTRKEAIKGITKTLSSALPTILQVVMMLVSMRNPAMAPLANLAGGAAGGGVGGGLGDMISKVLGGLMGGKGEEEEEGDNEGESPLTSFLKKKSGGDDNDDEDEDDEGDSEGGGFNLGELVNQVMPSVMGMMGGMQQKQQPMYSPQAAQPEIHSGHHHHKNRMNQYEQGDGVRPTFMDVEIGNSAAATVQPVIPPGQKVNLPDNIYENIQSEQEVINNEPTGVSPELVGMIEEGKQKADENTDVNDPNVIKLPRYQDKLLGENSKMTSPEKGVVIPQPRQTVNEYQGDDDDDEEGGDDPYPIYQTEDFDDMPDEQLRPAQNEGLESMRSAESYFNSINSQMKKRAKKKK